MAEIKKHLEKAYPLFREWVTKAMARHPEFNFHIKEVTEIKNSLEHAIRTATFTINKEERAINKQNPGYNYGFFCGFIEGNLNVTWYHEYIYKQKNNFKTLIALDVLDNYLKIDDLLKIRLASSYIDYYNKEVNIEDIDCRITRKVTDNLGLQDIKKLENPILIAIENIKIDIITKIYDDEVPEFLSSATEYFSEEEVDELLKLL
jgi:hypothetical protein